MKRNGFPMAFQAVMVMMLFMGCDLADIKGNGVMVSQERAVTEFERVVAHGVANVNVHFSETYKVVVTTDSNIQDSIGINSGNNMLHIENKSGSYSPTKLTVDVYMPELTAITLKGSGNIKINNGNTSGLEINLSGSGNIDTQNCQVQNVTIILSGSGTIKTMAADTLTGRISGSGSIDAHNHEVQNAEVAISGSGAIKIWAAKSITGTISGSGIIWYKGSPTINVNITGSGAFKPLI
ncbi:MAG: DUF2807 domain-containing protein [Treponema sp.]|jgi:hypothetical protein|nr:DUF2807 domain-containing protein [Treponema sp.]